MSPMFTSKRLSQAFLLATVAASVAAPAATAASSGSSGTFGIVNSALGQVAKDSSINLTAASGEIKPCLGTFESLLPVNGSTTVNPAANPLINELSGSYEAIALSKPLDQLAAMGAKLSKVKSSTKQIKTLALFAPVIKGLNALHFCTDLNTWSATQFAAASEPAGTRDAGPLTTKFAAPSDALSALSTASRPLGLTLSRSQASQLRATAKKALKRLGADSQAASERASDLVATTAPSAPTGPTGPTGATGATGATGPTS